MSAAGSKPTPEIEVSPEMIAAGAEALSIFDGGFMETHGEAAERIFRIMGLARAKGLAAARLEIERGI